MATRYTQQEMPLSTTASNLSLPGGLHQESTTPHQMSTFGGNDTTTSYEQSRRQISSVVLSEEILGHAPEPQVKYVEVEIHQEVVREVPVQKFVDREVIVPKYEVEYIDRIVEVPQIQYVDRTVEKTMVQEVVRHVPVVQYQDVPREVVVTVPRVEIQTVEEIREVPGQIIEVEKPYDVEQRVEIMRHADRQMPVVVSQTIRPVITESADIIDVDIYEYEPEVIPVEIPVAKPVASHLVAVGATQEIHQAVTVPAAQYNTILRTLNPHLSMQDQQQLPYLRDSTYGGIQFLNQHETPGSLPPVATALIHPEGTAANLLARGGRLENTQPLRMNPYMDMAGQTGASARSTSQLTAHHQPEGVTYPSNFATYTGPLPTAYGQIDLRDGGVATDAASNRMSIKTHSQHRSIRRASKPAQKKIGCSC